MECRAASSSSMTTMVAPVRVFLAAASACLPVAGPSLVARSGQPDGERGAGPGSPGGFDDALVVLDDGAGDGKPQAVACPCASCRRAGRAAWPARR